MLKGQQTYHRAIRVAKLSPLRSTTYPSLSPPAPGRDCGPERRRQVLARQAPHSNARADIVDRFRLTQVPSGSSSSATDCARRWIRSASTSCSSGCTRRGMEDGLHHAPLRAPDESCGRDPVHEGRPGGEAEDACGAGHEEGRACKNVEKLEIIATSTHDNRNILLSNNGMSLLRLERGPMLFISIHMRR
jgi:hypothetical protein